jgi:hypothetical protein
MRTLRLITWLFFCVMLSAGSAFAQQKISLGENAALRYWSAFAEMQDSAISEEQAKKLNAILDGTAPYEDSKYKELVEINRPALETMARGTTIPNCDWGVDYALQSEAPVDYVRKGLTLGRLNVLYAFHLLLTGDNDGAVRVLAAGVRFSRDVANQGTLFATVAAKTLIVAHLRTIEFAIQTKGLSAPQKSVLLKSLSPLGAGGLNWESGMKRELQGVEQKPAALGQIVPAYLTALNNPSTLPKLQQMIAAAPQPLRDMIPNPSRVLQEKQDLAEKLLHVRSMLQ